MVLVDVFIAIMFVVHVYDKTNMIVCLVWNDWLELSGGEFEHWLEQKC